MGAKVRISADSPSTVRATVLDVLDDETGRVLCEVVATAAHQGAQTIEVDLCPVRSYTADGIRSLVALQDLATHPGQRVVFLADTPRSRSAILALQTVAAGAVTD